MVCENFYPLFRFDQLNNQNTIRARLSEINIWGYHQSPMRGKKNPKDTRYLCQTCPGMQINSPAFQISCNRCSHFIIKTSTLKISRETELITQMPKEKKRENNQESPRLLVKAVFRK